MRRRLPTSFSGARWSIKTQEPPGTIVVDPKHRFLYHVSGGGMAMRYGVSVGKSSKAWSGEAVIKRMAKWPVWVPAPYHLEEKPSLAKYINGMPGGPDNPMGARACISIKARSTRSTASMARPSHPKSGARKRRDASAC